MIFLALAGLHFTLGWLTAPLGRQGLSAGLFIWVLVLGQLVDSPRCVAWLNRKRGDGEGLWLTPTSARVQRLTLSAPLLGLIVYLLYLAVVFNGRGDGPRLGVALAVGSLAIAGLVWTVRLALSRRVELRIDGEGVYVPKWGAPIAWKDIAFASPPRRGDRSVHLMVGPEAAPGLPAATRRNGGFALVRLDHAEVEWAEIVAALQSARPSLSILPWSGGGVVLPIPGSADLPDVVSMSDGLR